MENKKIVDLLLKIEKEVMADYNYYADECEHKTGYALQVAKEMIDELDKFEDAIDRTTWYLENIDILEERYGDEIARLNSKYSDD